VPVPVVRTAPPDDGGVSLSRALSGDEVGARPDWVVFTSAVAVEQVMDRLRDGRDLAGVRLAVVGPATAAALRARGLVADVVAEPPTAEGLIESMPGAPETSEPRRVLYPRADRARPVVADGLRAKGWEVDDVVAYRTVPVSAGELSPGLLDDAAAADAVTFTSPSTVTAYLELSAGRTVPPVVVCIGPVTAAAAREAGLTVACEATDPSADGLVAALVACLGGKGTPGPPVR